VCVCVCVHMCACVRRVFLCIINISKAIIESPGGLNNTIKEQYKMRMTYSESARKRGSKRERERERGADSNRQKGTEYMCIFIYIHMYTQDLPAHPYGDLHVLTSRPSTLLMQLLLSVQVCLYVCMYVCMYLCMYVRTYACKYV